MSPLVTACPGSALSLCTSLWLSVEPPIWPLAEDLLPCSHPPTPLPHPHPAMLNFPLLTHCLPPSSMAIGYCHAETSQRWCCCQLELGCDSAGPQWGGERALEAACTEGYLELGKGILQEQPSPLGSVMLLQEHMEGRTAPGTPWRGSISMAALLVWQLNVPTARLIDMATATIVLQHHFEALASASLWAITAGPTCEGSRGCCWLGAPAWVAPSQWCPMFGARLPLPRASALLAPRAVPAVAHAVAAWPGVLSLIPSWGPMLLAASS